MSTSEFMAKLPPPPELEPPLYIRWIPDACPYALEMRLDLITRLKSELDPAGKMGVELGGFFMGTFPTPDSPTLRLDEVLVVPRTLDSGPEYCLDNAHLRQAAEFIAAARSTDRRVVGFFRSHLRETPPVPSAADFGILSQHFPEGLYAFLLIQAGNPRHGAFYLALNGVLPESPSTPLFPFEESGFRSLPEVPAEATEDVRNFGLGRQKVRREIPWLAIASVALLLCLIGVWTFGSRVSQFFRPDSNQIGLNVMSTGSHLKITWDHSAPILLKALGATIDIQDGRSERVLRLDSDDLRLGQVAYERLTTKVNVVMRLDTPGFLLPPQTFDWTGD